MQTPLRRLAKPQDIASAIAFLLNEESAFISGETLRVCGGQVML
jgi:3-oxoacyl-[acyl-carrier protein] reductase